ncbi:membrane integrity-associated transporter subunit PqiC [Pseudomonas sp.]|uniref:PqiC family protein n=1 Tax=Pseudomonas sp. TaxID=306 RepID=UPI0026188A12|nr:PqiC family protein [Pseudomonas sp.]
MNIAGRVGLIALIAGLSGCASTPIHYHTLVSPSSVTSTRLPPAPFLIDVMAVGVPVQIDQPQWVVRLGANSVGVLEGERWGAPLSDELRSALSAELTQRLNTQDTSGLTPSSDKPVLRIKVQVRRFDSWPGRQVELYANWSLSFADDAPPGHLICEGQFREDAPGSYVQLATAQQRVVTTMGTRIADDARKWWLSRSTGCTCLSKPVSSAPCCPP